MPVFFLQAFYFSPAFGNLLLILHLDIAQCAVCTKIEFKVFLSCFNFGEVFLRYLQIFHRQLHLIHLQISMYLLNGQTKFYKDVIAILEFCFGCQKCFSC